MDNIMSISSTKQHKYNFPKELLVYLNLKDDIYSVSYIVSDIIRKCEPDRNRVNRYIMPNELYSILVPNVNYNRHWSGIPMRLSHIKQYVNTLKFDSKNNDYISVTDVLSAVPVKQLIVII